MLDIEKTDKSHCSCLAALCKRRLMNKYMYPMDQENNIHFKKFINIYSMEVIKLLNDLHVIGGKLYTVLNTQ